MTSSRGLNPNDSYGENLNRHGGRSQQNPMAMSMTSPPGKVPDQMRMNSSYHSGARPKEMTKDHALLYDSLMVHKSSKQTRNNTGKQSDDETDTRVQRYQDSATAEMDTDSTNGEFSINVKVRYNTKQSSRSNEVIESIPFNLDDYMKWHYALNTPAILDECNKQLDKVEGRLKLYHDSMIIIHDDVSDMSHVEKVVVKTIEIVLKHGQNLKVDVFVIKNGNAEQHARELQRSKFKCVFIDAIAKDRLSIVYEPSAAETMKAHFANMIGQELKPVGKENELTYKMDAIMVQLFMKANIKNSLVNMCPNVSINFEPVSKAFLCHLKGPDAEVKKVMERIELIVKNKQYQKVCFHKTVAELVHELSVTEELNAHFEKQNIGCVVEQIQHEVGVYGFDAAVLKTATAEIRRCISQCSVLVTGTWREPDNIADLINRVRRTYQGRIALQYCEGARLIIVGLCDVVRKAEQDVKELMKCIHSHFVVESHVHMAVLRNVISEISSKYQVQICLLEHQELHDFVLCGLYDNNKSAMKEMEEVMKDVFVQEVCFPTKVWSSTSGAAVKEQIERENNVLIEQQSNGIEVSNKNDQDGGDLCANRLSADEIKGSKTWSVSQYKIILLKGLLADCGANVVVHTKPATSASEPISRQRDMGHYNEVEIRIPPWVDGKCSEGKKVEQLIENVLLNVGEEDSIAIKIDPLANWPIEKYASCIVQAVVHFFQNPPKGLNLRFVQLVTDKKTTFQVFTRCIGEALNGNQRNIQENIKSDVKVKVVSGELNKIKADILVNTTAPNLDLSYGRVSLALLKSAGPEIQIECNNKFPGGIGRVEVAVTGGYNLDCKLVFHGTFTKYRKSEQMECIKDLRKFMKICFEAASDYKMKSIAFPVIGTGNLRYPIDIVAAEMFTSFEKFRTSNRKTSLELVLFVVYHGDKAAIQEFSMIENDMVAKEKESEQPKLRITGRKRDVENAMVELQRRAEHLDMTVDTVVVEVIPDVSRAVYAALINLFAEHVKTIQHQNAVSLKLVDDHIEVHGESKKKVKRTADEVKKMLITIRGMNKEGLQLSKKDEEIQQKLVSLIREVNLKHEQLFCFLDIYHQFIIIFARSVEELEKVKGLFSKLRKIKCATPVSEHSNTHRYQPLYKPSVGISVYKVGDVIVKVYQVNILQAPVECIVNAANEDLLHVGGIAFDIANAAGENLRKESEHIVHQGHLKVGDVVKTSAGHLHFKCVLHAVGPCWNDYKPITEESLKRCEDDLYRAVKDSFMMADRYNLKSIALPAISSAIFGVPKEICCTQYARALKSFCAKRKSIEEIHFVDLDLNMISSMEHTFKVMIVDGKPSPYNCQDLIQPYPAAAIKSKENGNPKDVEDKKFTADQCSVGKATGRSKPKNLSAYDKTAQYRGEIHVDIQDPSNVPAAAALNTSSGQQPDLTSAASTNLPKQSRRITSENMMLASAMHPQIDPFPVFIEDGDKLICQFTDYNFVYIYTADILNVGEVDAIVCSEDKSGRGQGMIAYELLKVGGNEYKMEKEQAFRADRQFGDVFITRGGKSLFRYIIHAIIPHNQPEALGHVFMKIFKEAVYDMVGSIVMSLIGSGAAKTEPKQAAEMLFNSYKNFCQENADKVLVVHVVNLDKSITDTVINVFKDNIGYKTQAQAITDPMNDSRRNSGSTRKKPVQGKGDPYEKSRYMTEGTKQTESGQHTSSGGANLRTGDELGSKSTETVQKAREEEKEDNCVICMDKIDDPKKLKCGHVFCKDCIDQYFKIKQACPTCGTVCGIITGDQPSSGQMEIMKLITGVAGYQGMGSIAASYSFPDGYQEAHHPRPKAWYKGITRTAYLPDNEEGRKICAMLREAFNRKLVFTIGVSRTTGQEGVITWNDIHHKTDHRPNTQFGYPDPTYMARVTDELGAKGVTEADIDPAFLKKIKSLSGNKRLSNL